MLAVLKREGNRTLDFYISFCWKANHTSCRADANSCSLLCGGSSRFDLLSKGSVLHLLFPLKLPW